MSNDEPLSERRIDGTAETPIERAMAAYDRAFEARLVDEITEAIANASMLTDGDGRPVIALRLGECANALTTVLASTLALSPSSVRSSKAIKQLAAAFRAKLLARVRRAERDPSLSDFKSRCFHDDDRARGGRA
jgi:fructose-1,6-bisphosphatase/sedoheptulose 1,7-bisphosphatase-like protein